MDLTYANGYLYYPDYRANLHSGVIVKMDPDTLRDIDVFLAPSHSINAMAFDGTNLLGNYSQTGGGPRQLCLISPSNGAVIETWTIPFTSRAMDFDIPNKTLYLVSGSDIITATIVTAGMMPVADAGVNQTVRDSDGDGSEQVTLDGSASFYDNGSIVSWKWSDEPDSDDGPLPEAAEIPDGETPSALFSFGIHIVTLTVTNDVGYSDSETVTVTVLPPILPAASAGGNQTVTDSDGTGSEQVNFDGSASLSSNGNIVSWEWSDDLGDMIPDGEMSTATLSVGSHTVTLTVTDNYGIVNTDTVIITVTDTVRPEAGIMAWGRINESPDGDDFIAVSAAWNANVALKSDGSVVVWGATSWPIQTDVPAVQDFVAISSGYQHVLAIRSNGSLAAWGNNSEGQSNVPAGNDYIAVAGGNWHSLALRDNGSIEAFGDNYFGQLNKPAGNDFTAIAAGHDRCLALRSDGSLTAWGKDLGGIVSDLPVDSNFAAISVGTFGVALHDDGTLVNWGTSYKVPPGNDFVAIEAGKNHCLALRADGSLVAWGQNMQGECKVPLGVGFDGIAAGNMYNSVALIIKQFPPVAVAGCPSSDLSGDCRVNLDDFAILAAGWQTTYDADDLSDMASQWLDTGCPTADLSGD